MVAGLIPFPEGAGFELAEVIVPDDIVGRLVACTGWPERRSEAVRPGPVLDGFNFDSDAELFTLLAESFAALLFDGFLAEETLITFVVGAGIEGSGGGGGGGDIDKVTGALLSCCLVC